MDDPNGQQENDAGKPENDVGKQENDVAGKSEQKTEELKTAEDYEDAAFAAMKRPGAAPTAAAKATKLKAKTGPKTKVARSQLPRQAQPKARSYRLAARNAEAMDVLLA